MAVGTNSYGTVAEVAALSKRYTSSGTFTTTTNPTEAQVERFIDRVSSIVNVILARLGFTTPVVDVEARPAIEEFVIQEVVQMVLACNGAGLFAPGSEALRKRTPFQIILDDAQSFFEDNAVGLENLGAARPSGGLTFGLAVREVDDAGDDLEPPFGWKQMGNVPVDWDVGT